MIFYLSGTGNTLWAAEELSEYTGEQLINIAEAINGDCRYTPDEEERIGFCFPVHGWRPPKLVRSFINKLHINNGDRHYCYALCTAGDNIGETIDILKKDLGKKGITLNSSFSLIMPESYVGLPFMDIDKPENERKKKETSAKQLEEYKRCIYERKKDVERLTTGRWPRINSRIIGGYFTNVLITDKPFHTVSDRCVGCGLCQKACPVDNIIWTAGKEPQWKHNGSCLTCFACYHHCPHHAIEFGRRTKNKGQYYFKKNINK